ncbi:MAG: MYXO-CTERM sorting domain-containing protein [Pseudomonadota bacterium]
MCTMLRSFLVTTLVLSPLLARAQEDAGEDAALSAEDGAVALDVTSVEDAARSPDAVFAEDAAAGEDATPAEDAAAALDASTADASPGCGTVAVTGACDGDTLRYCESGTLVEIDCPSNLDIGGPTTTCGLVDCDDQPYPACFGYWCVARLGADCQDRPCDVNLGHGCLGGVCAISTSCDPDTYMPTCTGTLATSCNYTVNNTDCAAGGEASTCAPPPNLHTSACVGLEGAACRSWAGVDYVCAAGLTCSGGICTAATASDAGTGTDASPRDIGATPGDASADDDDDSTGGGCGCSATRTGSSVVLILAGILGLAMAARRRQPRRPGARTRHP